MTRLWLFLADLIVPRPPSHVWSARMNPAKQNPPITAAGLAAAVNGLIVAFGHFTDEQNAAIGAVVIPVAAWSQRFTTPAWSCACGTAPGAVRRWPCGRRRTRVSPRRRWRA